MLVTHQPSAGRTERILQRVGQDGVDSVVDQFTGSKSMAERKIFRAVLLSAFRSRASRWCKC